MLFITTQHAKRRMQQRGMRPRDVALVSRLADTEVAVGRGLSALSLSREAFWEALADGVPADALARITGSVLVTADDGALVTCAHSYGARKGSYARRDRRKFWTR